MKKLIALLLSLTCGFSLAACTPQEENPSSTSSNTTTGDEAGTESEGKTLVVYFSATGNTERIANFIAETTEGDIFVIEPAEPYTDEDLNWTDENSRVTYEHENEEARNVELVHETVDNWDSYDTVFIGYPIWWGIAAWPVSSFVAANDFSGKTVIPFATSASSGLGESGNLLAETAQSGEWLEGQRFTSRTSEEEVVEWIDGLELAE
ncbi:flavodoxin [Traorella massiliensis]|uniref:flavodoxin n=1 Tax=Traorella massiliensis TaxID=1903263 RepID=UPI00248F0A21|nr:flavodoxin [Traorella massiliensis]